MNARLLFAMVVAFGFSSMALAQEQVESRITLALETIDSLSVYADRQFANGMNYIDENLVIGRKITFQENAIVEINPDLEGDIIFAAEEFIFDAPQLSLRIKWRDRTSLSGEDGENGIGYSPGSPASCCKPGSRKHGNDGRPGGQGESGGDGESRQVPSLIFVVGDIVVRTGTIQLAAIDASVELSGPSGGIGGRGGNGGWGEKGGRGVDAEMGFFKCKHGAGDGGRGGNGGDAGAGGNGGNGSDGADFLVYAPEDTLAIVRLFNIRIDGGQGGAAGPAGRAGRGGEGGANGTRAGTIGCGGGDDGTRGTGGSQSYDGLAGSAGSRGELVFVPEGERTVSSLFQ